MKPTSNNNHGCDPMSSNCVIWQGPDLKCIDLCKGDSISEVVSKMATELCMLLDTFDVESYEIDCLGLGACTPKDFKELLQILINKICEANGVPVEEGTAAPMPAESVPLSEAFYYENEKGDTVKHMTVSSYVVTIGNRLVKLISQINTNSFSIETLSRKVSALEAINRDVVLPDITPIYILTGPVSIDEFILELEKQLVDFRTYVGSNDQIVFAIQSACAGLNQANRLHGPGNMSAIDGWINSPNSLSETVSNLWRTTCDLRNAVQYIMLNGVNNGADAIEVKMVGFVTDTQTLRLDFSGTIPNDYVDTDKGTTIELYNADGQGPQIINDIKFKRDYFDTGGSKFITLSGVSSEKDLVVKMTYRLEDPNNKATVSNCVSTTVLGLNSCPNVSYQVTQNLINYSVDANQKGSLIVQLWDASQTQLLQSQTKPSGTEFAAGTFQDLDPATTYSIVVVKNNKSCDAVIARTLDPICEAPVLLPSTIDYSNPEGSAVCS